MTSPAQPAGWYADPHGLPAQRWWDGHRWTEHVQPGGTPIPPVTGFFPPMAPRGRAAPGPHTVAPTDPEQAEIFAARQQIMPGSVPPVSPPAGPFLRPAGPENAGDPAEAMPTAEVPPMYRMPPVDAAPALPRPAVSPSGTPSAGEAPGPRRWRLSPILLATLGVVALAVIAYLVA
ncbi:DUF2510 domain-containing protein [Actinoplanes sp. NBRC 101535]|uniref:DUF2510 domain-containing protein n=1 Tax=Actinoplanes sp. NBRC 101535 TaxID=3032196 RepID=UPI0024A04A17|nr:DUF2510 domain-containing protein [Actinoplanes sp. NBRC 101535]GLY06786.1 hypothetical protein Acsp01_71650 [Actinoplanes sp. NBRC 101535]